MYIIYYRWNDKLVQKATPKKHVNGKWKHMHLQIETQKQNKKVHAPMNVPTGHVKIISL